MKNCCQQQDKSYRNTLRHAGCCTAPMCQKSLRRYIRLYCKKLIASKTNKTNIYVTAPLCHTSPSGHWHRNACCVCYTAPLCHHRIFSKQLLQLRFTGAKTGWSIAPKLSSQFFSCTKLKRLYVNTI